MVTTSSTMTIDEFIDWENARPDRNEFWRGQILPMDGDSTRHNRVVSNIVNRLHDHLSGTPCEVFARTMKLRLTDGILYPDIQVVCGQTYTGDETTLSDAVLIIEALSPDTRGCDQRGKFSLYRQLASLREYVLLDPASGQAEIHAYVRPRQWMLVEKSPPDDLVLASVDVAMSMDDVLKGTERRADRCTG